MKFFDKKSVILTFVVGITEGIAALVMTDMISSLFETGICFWQVCTYILLILTGLGIKMVNIRNTEEMKRDKRIFIANAFFGKYRKPKERARLSKIYESDLPCCAEFVNEKLPLLFLNGIFIMVYLGILVKESPGYALIIMAIGVLQSVVPAYFGRIFSENYERTVSWEEKIEDFYYRAAAHFDKTFFLSKAYMSDRLKHMNEAYIPVGVQSEKTIQLYKSAGNAFFVLTQFGLFFIGLLFIEKGSMGLSQMLGEIYLGVRVIGLITDGSDQLKDREIYLKARERIDSVMEKNGTYKIVKRRFSTVRYERFATEFTDYTLSFEINSGEKILVKGANGSGKSTLIRTFLGMTDSYQGKILVDGNDLKETDISSAVCYIPQNVQQTGVSLNDLIEGRMTGCTGEMAEKFQINADLRERSMDELSSGQAKKIQLIYAFASQKPLLIFDEPENSLDEYSQKIFKSCLQAYNGTCVVITNRNLYDDMGFREIFIGDGEKE